MSTYSLVALTILGCAHPVLALANLWQRKEWRCDRLRAHLEEYSWFLQLVGRARPSIFLLGILIAWTTPHAPWLLGTLSAFALLSLLQIAQGTHRPQWTKKALAVIGLTLCIDLLLVFFALRFAPTTLIVLPLVQFLPLSLAYTLLLPLDSFLKHRIIERARRVRGMHKHLTVIGITGSAGKTTTKELVFHLLKDRGAIATPEHVNTELGVASWLTKSLKDMPTDSQAILIVEMGAYKKGEIALMCSYVQPTIGIITSIGEQHLALFGSRASILHAKGELFEALPGDGLAIANADQEDIFPLLEQRAKCTVLGVGTGRSGDLQARDIEETSSGVRFSLEQETYATSLFGTHNVTNILAAIAVARHCGISNESIRKQLATFKNLHRTFEVKMRGGLTLLDDTYNSSPLSALAAIAWAKGRECRKKILLLAPLLELGRETDRFQREIIEQASAVFNTVYVLEPRMLKALNSSARKNVFLLQNNETTERAGSGDLLVCIGRMPESTIERFLPIS